MRDGSSWMSEDTMMESPEEVLTVIGKWRLKSFDIFILVRLSVE